MRKLLKPHGFRKKSLTKIIIIMKLTTFLLIIGVLQLSASTYSQTTLLNLKIENGTIADVFKQIENQSEFSIFYKNDHLDIDKVIDIEENEVSVEKVLGDILFDTELTFTIIDKIIVIMPRSGKQDLKVTGTVTDASTGEPLAGVYVLIAGSGTGVITNDAGNYSIDITDDNVELTFSYIGYVTEKVLVSRRSLINISMVPDIQNLEEIVVTALGIKRQAKALGYAQQELGSDELSASREANVASLLTAKIAGVRVTKTSSGTGGSSSITIRGAKSLLGNNQPLYVVDGVPITNIGHTSGGVWAGDNDLGDGIGDINSEDIESMSVLKGPNASALYGARGSNGVILITTKSGPKKKGIGIEVNSNTSFETINLVPTFQNYYATGYEETNLYGKWFEIPEGSGKTYETISSSGSSSWGPPLDGRRTVVNPFVFPEDAYKKTLVLLPQPEDNVREFYETGIYSANTIAITGSSEKTSARLSIGNITNKGIIPNWKLNKQTIVFSANSQVNKYLSFDGKINYIHDEGNNRPALGSANDNVNRTFVTLGRYVPLDFLKEYYEKTGKPGSWPGVNYNPYYIVNALKNHDTKDRIIGLVSANLKLNSWLSLLGRAGTDFYIQRQEKKWPIDSKGSVNYLGRVYNRFGIIKDINADVILTAAKSLSDKFDINASIGSSISYQERNYQEVDGQKFKVAEVYNVSNCQTIIPSYYISKKEMQSVYFMGQLAYNNYLFLDVTGRNDWSSALGTDNYSFFYPSVSASFVFSDAFKAIPANILSFGKLRLSWAQVGNDSDPYLTKSGFITTATTYGGKGLTWMDDQKANYDLKNELTESWEAGADLRFLNNRLGIDFTYYNGKTTNQILPVEVSISSGYSTVVINAGEVQNKGIELALNLNPIRTSWGFSWDINGTFSKNKSKVVSLAPGIESLTLGGGSTCTIEARPGQAYGNIIGYAYLRAPDGQKIVSDGGYYMPTSTQQILGNITPDWIGGLNNTFSFKGLSLNVLLDFVQGNEISSATKYQMGTRGTGKWTLEGRRLHDINPETEEQYPLVGILDGVVAIDNGSGNITYVKNTLAVNGQTYWGQRGWSNIGEEFVIDGSYISLREVMLTYSFSSSFLKKTPIDGISISAIGRNLLYLEEHMQDMGVSPESAPNTSAGYAGIEEISMPSTRTWGFNVKLTF